MMLPILGMDIEFLAKVQNFVCFKFKVSSLSHINQIFALYLQIKSLLIRVCVRDCSGILLFSISGTKDTAESPTAFRRNALLRQR
jgi:hypothetical protein